MWFAVGILLSIPLILYCNSLKGKALIHILGTSLLIAAVIYIGFAIVWGDSTWIVIESLGLLGYGFFYWLAIRYSLLWIAIGWAAHPIWDIALHLNGAGAHVVPEWYAIFCVSFDISIAVYILYRWYKAKAPD